MDLKGNFKDAGSTHGSGGETNDIVGLAQEDRIETRNKANFRIFYTLCTLRKQILFNNTSYIICIFPFIIKHCQILHKFSFLYLNPSRF